MPTRSPSPKEPNQVPKAANVWRFGHDPAPSRTMADCAFVPWMVLNSGVVKAGVANTSWRLLLR